MKVADVLDRIACSCISVEGESRELLRKLTLLDVLGKRRVGEASSQNQVLGKLSTYDPLMDQLLNDREICGCMFGVTLCPRGPILKRDNWAVG